MHSAVISLGSNKGNREGFLAGGLNRLEESAGRIRLKSAIYETEPWGNPDQPRFLNMVAVVETELSPRELLNLLLRIEKESGRERKGKWISREIDLDIIYFDDQVIEEPGLTIPHPHMHLRKFVLVPLEEILPAFVHPVLKRNTSSLMSTLADKLPVTPYASGRQADETKV